MKKILSAITATAVTVTVTGCGGNNNSGFEIPTQETTAKMTMASSSQTVSSISSVSSEIAETTVVLSNTTVVYTTTESYSLDSTTTASHNSNNSETSAVVTESNEKTTSALYTVSSHETTQPTETTENSSVHEKSSVISAYEEAVLQKIEMMTESDYESVYVSYTLFDMDLDSVPELIVKCGTSDDDFQNTFYTYDDFGIKVISDGTASGHSGFAHDIETDNFVSAYCEKGRAVLNWLSYDGSDIEIIKSCEFDYNGEMPYEIQAEDFGVEWLPFACFTSSNGNELTWNYRVVNHGLEYDEIYGRDFGFLYNFEF